MTATLKQLSREMKPLLEQEMRAVLQASNPASQPDPFYGMLHYHMGWTDDQFQPAQVHSGKQIRPLLCLISCLAAGGNWEQALPAAAAIELLHNFSLIHDDIEDASPTRRGRQTLWKIWGMEQAINTGDAMFALSHLALLRLAERGVPAETVVRALRRFDETCVWLTQGQHADMDFEQRTSVTVAEYLQMIEGKTAVLLALCAELGARIAGCPATTVAHYSAFGRDLGLAFQVKDDILGIWGDEALTGKSAATDIVTKKKTLPVLHGLAHSDKLQHLYATAEGTDPSFVTTAITLLNETGSRQFATEKATDYSESARQHLLAAHPQGNGRSGLHELADMLLQRNY